MAPPTSLHAAPVSSMASCRMATLALPRLVSVSKANYPRGVGGVGFPGVKEMVGEFRRAFEISDLGAGAGAGGVRPPALDVRAHRCRFFKKHKESSQEKTQLVVRTLSAGGVSTEQILEKHGRWLKPPDWFSILDGLGRRRRWQLALEVFRWIQIQKWYKPDNGYYAKLISIMGKERQYRLAMWLFAEMKKQGCRPDTSLYNSVMGVYLRSEDKQKGFAKAVGLLKEMKLKRRCLPNIVTYNILSRAAAQVGDTEKVNRFLREILERDLVPDHYTFNGLIDAYGKLGKIVEMEEMFKKLREEKLKPDLVTFNTLVDSYGKAGEFEKMEQVLASMSAPRRAPVTPGIKTFNSMITNYGNAGLWEKAEWVFQEMKKAGVQPTFISHEALLGAYGSSGLFDRMQDCVSRMKEAGIKPESSTLNRMMDVYCSHDLTDEAESLLENCRSTIGVEATSLSFAILIRAYKISGKVAKIQSLLDKMKVLGLKATKETYLDVLESMGLELEYNQRETEGIVSDLDGLSSHDSEEDNDQNLVAPLENRSESDLLLDTEREAEMAGVA